LLGPGKEEDKKREEKGMLKEMECKNGEEGKGPHNSIQPPQKFLVRS